MSDWVLVAGASRGIGLATAQLALSKGHSVIAAARDIDKLEQEFSSYGSSAVCVQFDFSSLNGIDAFSSEISERIGGISGLFHAAGMQKTLPLSLSKPEISEEIFRLNTFSAIELVRVFSRKGRAVQGASFVLSSSLAAHEGAAGGAVYAASKGAIEGFIPAASAELAPRGMRINAIAPGVVKTDMSMEFISKMSQEQISALERSYPLGLGNPEDVAAFVCWLLSKESRWVTGQTFIIDGGRLSSSR